MSEYAELVKWCRSWDDEKQDEVADAIEALEGKLDQSRKDNATSYKSMLQRAEAAEARVVELEAEREAFIKLQTEVFKRAGAGERL